MRWFVRVLVFVALGTVGGLVALALSPPIAGDVGPGRVEMQVRTAIDGRTEIAMPPLGEAHAATHWAPTLVAAKVQSVDVAELQDFLLADRPTQQFVAIAEQDVSALVRRVAAWSLLAGLVGGALAGALAPTRSWRRIGLAATSGVGAVALVFGVTWRTFDPQAFSNPTYTGALERAPAVIETVGRHVNSVSAVRARVDTLGRQIAELYATAFTDDPQIRGGGTRILHISDIHSNPLAMDVVIQLVDSFGVDAVIDTGDLTSFGLPVESRIASLVAGIDVPYLYVPGNHDSEANRSAIDRTPNIELLDGQVVRVNDLRIVGVADPTFTATNVTTGPEGEVLVAEYADETADVVRELEVDVLAVHNEFQATESFGLVPLILNGHRHERRYEESEGTIRLAVGSTGASGLGYFTVETDQPFEAQILHFAGRCLRTRDYLRVRGIGGDLQIDRRTYRLVSEPGAERPSCVESDFGSDEVITDGVGPF